MTFAILLILVLCLNATTAFDARNGFFPVSLTCPNNSSEDFLEDWIISERHETDGWGKQTHRAVIAFFVLDHQKGSYQEERSLIITHLETQLAKALLRNSTVQVETSDLSLFIHALLVAGKDPRNFYGVDLVARLEFKVEKESNPHPLALLALCNAGVNEKSYLRKIGRYLSQRENTVTSLELQAIAMKAYACAYEADPNHFRQEFSEMEAASRNFLSHNGPEGSFGNIYTTSLAVQALYQYNSVQEKARIYLDSRILNDMNILSVYSTALALRSDQVRFIKDLALKPEPLLTHDGFPTIAELKRRPMNEETQISIIIGTRPKSYYTVTLKYPLGASLFDIMRLVANENRHFRFLYNLDARGKPVIYSISGIPNQPREGLNWNLIKESEVKHGDRHTSLLTPMDESPSIILPERGTHWRFHYNDAFESFMEMQEISHVV